MNYVDADDDCYYESQILLVPSKGHPNSLNKKSK